MLHVDLFVIHDVMSLIISGNDDGHFHYTPHFSFFDSFGLKIFTLSTVHGNILYDSHSLYQFVPLKNLYGLVFVIEIYCVFCEVVTKLTHG